MGIYDDIVNIVSPGGLPHSITIEDIFNGRSEARNRVIARVFKELGLIEQWGSGISRIINSCNEYGLQTPKIAEKNDFFDVEIIRPIPTDSGQLKQNVTDKPLEKELSADDYERLRTITQRKTRYTLISIRQ